jgi:hypothetical protein
MALNIFKSHLDMKLFFPVAIGLLLLAGCADDQPAADSQSFQMDSAFKAQETVRKEIEANRSKDTTKLVALPPVFEGDLVFQVNDDPVSLEWQKATGSKYSNVGMIFIRPRDQMYMVAEVLDSVHIMPLSDWVSRGQGQHVALLRLKNSNAILSEKKTEKLKAGVKAYKKLKGDPYFSWGDDAMYNSELIWKIYSNVLKIDLCTPQTLGSFNLNNEPLKSRLDKQYGGKIPKDDKAVSVDNLYKSPKLEVIFER